MATIADDSEIVSDEMNIVGEEGDRYERGWGEEDVEDGWEDERQYHAHGGCSGDVLEDHQIQDPGCNDACNDAPHAWMTKMKKKCLVQPTRIKVSSKFPSSIHRVPHILFQQDRDAYVPQVVSIGPLHYDKRKNELLAIEEHKWRYLNEIISREGDDWFKQCWAAVMKMEKEARDYYSQVIELDTYPFVEMMVLDGCFIIELFRKTWPNDFKDDPIFKADPIFKLHWLDGRLVIDLVMLENQIPYFILQKVFNLMDIPECSLERAASKFFRRWPFYRNFLPNRIEKIRTSKVCHLLHLVHESMVRSTWKRPQPAGGSTDSQVPSSKASNSIPCASKLQESGIKFKRNDYKVGAKKLLDIKFDKEKGIIKIPRIEVGDETNPLLRNLIAFEQCGYPCMKYISTYTLFMDSLIDSGKDVEILRENKIILNSLGSDEDVATLFNKIHKEVGIFRKSSYLVGVRKDINKCCESRCRRWRAILMRDYFKNPWAAISFIAALLLLLITMTQGFFSAFPKFAVGK